MKTMSTIVIKESREYQPDVVYKSIKDGLELIGTMSSFIKEADRVLIKPNMLAGCPPERAANTHPVVIEAIAKLVLESGGVPMIGDSPMFGRASEASKKIGYQKIAEKLKINIVDFVHPVRCEFKEGKIFKNFEVDKTIIESDKIINVAKLKTHTQMYMTLCVKNMFGSVVGRDKTKWHYIAGKSHGVFAKMLLELYSFTKPVLNIIDGIVGMGGYGPLSGPTRQIGVLLFGRDGVSVDRVACEIVGADPKEMPIFRANEELKVGVSRLEDIKILGDDISKFMIKDFEFPQLEAIDAGILPDFLKNRIKDKITPRPAIVTKKCKVCKKCIDACPTMTIGLIKGGVEIDYKNCIRCYCCIEACQYQAIEVKTPWLAKVTQRL